MREYIADVTQEDIDRWRDFLKFAREGRPALAKFCPLKIALMRAGHAIGEITETFCYLRNGSAIRLTPRASRFVISVDNPRGKPKPGRYVVAREG